MQGFKYTLKRFYKYRRLFILMLPGLILLIIFRYIPLYGLLLAFKDFDNSLSILFSPWAGLKHFDRLFSMPEVWNVVRNTVEISLLRLVFGFPMPIILALMLNELRSNRLKRTFQTISYLPHFLSWVVVAGLITELLSPGYGFLGFISKLFNFQAPVLLTSKTWFRPILILSGIWKDVGYSSILYIAAIANIDTQQYEAATIDGAGRFKRMWYITLPGLAPVITILLILQTSSILNAGFDQIFNLYNKQVYAVSDVIDTYIYRIGLTGFQYSFGTAVGLSKTAVAIVILLVADFIARKTSDYSIWGGSSK